MIEYTNISHQNLSMKIQLNWYGIDKHLKGKLIIKVIIKRGWNSQNSKGNFYHSND